MPSPIQLWVIVYMVNDARRSRRLRDLLGFAGNKIRPCVYEVAATRERIDQLLAELCLHLDPEDDVRVYRVCADCREKTLLFGNGRLTATRPAAIII